MGKKNKNNRNNNNKGNANKPVNSAPKAEEEVKAEEEAKAEVTDKVEVAAEAEAETEKVETEAKTEETEKAEAETKAEETEAKTEETEKAEAEKAKEEAKTEEAEKVEETEKAEEEVEAKAEETEKGETEKVEVEVKAEAEEAEAKAEETEKVEETEKAEAEEEVKAVKKEPVKRKIGRGVGITLIVVGALIIIIPCAILLSDLYTRKQAQKSLEKFQAAMTAAANESLANSASEAESAEAVSDKADPASAADTETKADASVSEQEDTTATGQAELNPSDGTSEGLEPEEGDLSLTEGDDAADASDESEPLEDEEPYIPEEEEEEEEEDEDPENIEINEAGVAFNNELFSSHRLVGQECIGSLYIEAIDLVYAIVEGVSDHEIGYAIGHFPDSVGIGKNGNCALAGHNGGTYGRYFGEIDELDFGDTIVMTDLYGRQTTYEVCSKFTCNPDQYSLVVGDVGKKGKFLTMMTCCENGTKRYVVRAKAIKK